jgi:hypothetical protein
MVQRALLEGMVLVRRKDVVQKGGRNLKEIEASWFLIVKLHSRLLLVAGPTCSTLEVFISSL